MRNIGRAEVDAAEWGIYRKEDDRISHLVQQHADKIKPGAEYFCVYCLKGQTRGNLGKHRRVHYSANQSFTDQVEFQSVVRERLGTGVQTQSADLPI